MDKRGFTLLELLIVVAIVGILAAIAVGAYYSTRARAYEAVAISYMRSWVPAQEVYLEKYGHYADADEQLAKGGLDILSVPPSKIPYDFSIDSTARETSGWWGRGTPTNAGLRYFYIDQSGVVISSLNGPPNP
jgi:prepilin-type N-terminal cleavage/methylation domain-containing protein